MKLFSFIVWNLDPDLLNLGGIRVRYYGLLFAAAFALGYYLILNFSKREKFPESWVDSLLVYMVVGTVIGARLGHCLFYEPAHYLANPLEILMVWKGGLASHGGAIGNLVAIWLFSRKISKRQYFWTTDRIVIVTALAAFFIRMGNFANSEIYGDPTQSTYGIVYAHDTDFARRLESSTMKPFYKDVNYVKQKSTNTILESPWYPINIVVDLKSVPDEKTASAIGVFLGESLKAQKNSDDEFSNIFIHENTVANISKYESGYRLTYSGFGVPKHPTHLYEAFSYLAIFLLLLWLYYKKEATTKSGLLTGLFFILVFSARFIIEFIKQNQVSFEDGMVLNMGQWLSIPFILGGMIVLIRSIKKSN